MYIEPNACDSFIIWDNILDRRQKRTLLNQTNLSRLNKSQILGLNTYEMNDDSKKVILEAFALYKKTDYFQNKVYPRYVRNVSTTVNRLSLFDVCGLIIPRWLDAELTRFQDNLREIDSNKLKNDFMEKETLHFNPNCYEGRLAYHIVMNDNFNDAYNGHMQIYNYTNAWTKISTFYNVTDNEFVSQDKETEGKLTNRLFFYDETSEKIAPKNIKCTFDHLATWLQYMILNEPMPFVNATNDCKHISDRWRNDNRDLKIEGHYSNKFTR